MRALRSLGFSGRGGRLPILSAEQLRESCTRVCMATTDGSSHTEQPAQRQTVPKAGLGPGPGAASTLSSPQPPLRFPPACAEPPPSQGRALPSVQPGLQPGRATWTALQAGLFLAPGLLPGMLGDQSHTEPPVSRAPGKQVTRLTCNPRGSAAERSPKSTDPAQAPPLPHLDATVASHCLLPSPLTPLLVQLTAIFAG